MQSSTESALNEGEEVVLSSNFTKDGSDCIEVMNLMDLTSMLTPESAFRFTAVQPK